MMTWSVFKLITVQFTVKSVCGRVASEKGGGGAGRERRGRDRKGGGGERERDEDRKG